MDETLRQVGGLLLGAIPTVVFMILLYTAYTFLVHRPLERVLAERHARTEGAVEKARADIAAAEARTAEYEHRLREARAALFQAQEARWQRAMQARVAAASEAHKMAQARVEQARAAIDRDKQTAQAALQAQSASLAAEIIRVVLAPAASGARQ
jgi:F-type H+-transporting ATPase subunit b